MSAKTKRILWCEGVAVVLGIAATFVFWNQWKSLWLILVGPVVLVGSPFGPKLLPISAVVYFSLILAPFWFWFDAGSDSKPRRSWHPLMLVGLVFHGIAALVVGQLIAME